MNKPARALFWVGLAVASGSGCGGTKETVNLSSARDAVASQSAKGSGDPRCDSTVAGRELSEYDTSGNDVPDVRKVFMRIGDPTISRLVLICREADVNGDGRKDVVRIYDDEGRSLREDADRNFDGKMDQHTIFQNGQIVRHEFDDNFDGKIETKVYYDKGKPSRAERDIAGRSTGDQWRPDRWEYFDGGRTVRMGTDLDGDARVDRWDRDAAWKKAQEQQAPNVAASDG